MDPSHEPVSTPESMATHGWEGCAGQSEKESQKHQRLATVAEMLNALEKTTKEIVANFNAVFAAKTDNVVSPKDPALPPA
jgi:hypothetical protein